MCPFLPIGNVNPRGDCKEIIFYLNVLTDLKKKLFITILPLLSTRLKTIWAFMNANSPLHLLSLQRLSNGAPSKHMQKPNPNATVLEPWPLRGN
jgi:hypothetical protein